MVLISTLFAGSNPTVSQMEELGFIGRLVMWLSYSRWSTGGLMIAYCKATPAIKLLPTMGNTIERWGYANIDWESSSNDYPYAEYGKLNHQLHHYIGMQLSLFFFFILLAVIAISCRVCLLYTSPSPRDS